MAKVYNFEASFHNNIWINKKAMFKKPLSVMLGIKGKADVAIIVYDDNYKKIGSVKTGLFEGSVNFPIGHLTKKGGYYRIKLVNRRDNRQVNVTYGQVYHT